MCNGRVPVDRPDDCINEVCTCTLGNSGSGVGGLLGLAPMMA